MVKGLGSRVFTFHTNLIPATESFGSGQFSGAQALKRQSPSPCLVGAFAAKPRGVCADVHCSVLAWDPLYLRFSSNYPKLAGTTLETAGTEGHRCTLPLNPLHKCVPQVHTWPKKLSVHV